MNKSNRRQIVEQLLQPWKDSGLSANKFCNLNNISVHTFKYWQYKIQEENRRKQISDFIPIRINNKVETFSEEKKVEIFYPNGVKITVPFGKSISLIRSLIKIV